MMKTDQTKKVIIKVEPEVQQENVKNARRGLKTLQPTAVNKENLAGRALVKGTKVYSAVDAKKEKPLLMHRETQTEEYKTNIEDLTGEEPSAEYWKRLAEKRQESLDESLHEIEKLKGNIEVLQEENRICKEMLEESKHLVEVLQEMINEGDHEDTECTEAEQQDSEGEST